MLERFFLTFLNIVLSMAVGWISFGAIYLAISEIQVVRWRAHFRKNRIFYPEHFVKAIRLQDSMWEYLFYGPVMPIIHHERRKAKEEERENEKHFISDD